MPVKILKQLAFLFSCWATPFDLFDLYTVIHTHISTQHTTVIVLKRQPDKTVFKKQFLFIWSINHQNAQMLSKKTTYAVMHLLSFE